MYYNIPQAHNFRGFAFSKLSQKQFSWTKDSVGIHRYGILKNCGVKFSRFSANREKHENYAPQKFVATG